MHTVQLVQATREKVIFAHRLRQSKLQPLLTPLNVALSKRIPVTGRTPEVSLNEIAICLRVGNPHYSAPLASSGVMVSIMLILSCSSCVRT